MALTIQSLGAGTLGTAAGPSTSLLAFTPSTTKSILIKNIMITNKNTTTTRKVNIYAYIKAGAAGGTLTEFFVNSS